MVLGSIGSLKTTTMRVFNGTSVLPLGGLVRTIVGGRWLGTRTFAENISVAARTSILKASPVFAGIATGSNPPFSITTPTVSPVARLRIVAVTPPDTLFGGSDT